MINRKLNSLNRAVIGIRRWMEKYGGSNAKMTITEVGVEFLDGKDNVPFSIK